MQRSLGAGAPPSSPEPSRGRQPWWHPGGWLSASQLKALKALAPHVWPHDRPDLQRRVALSLALMLAAKLITVAQTREEAIAKMRRALDEYVIEGINTTIPFHRKLMDDPAFIKGNYTTKFMESFVL